jgi:very-short-patch-repair endonuclease
MSAGTLNMLPRGQPKQDLLPRLCTWLWEGHTGVTHLYISDKNKYFFKLPRCKHGHLRLMTVQAAVKQLDAPKNQGCPMLFACERCSVGEFEGLLGPQACPEDMHRSKWEQWCWLNLQRVLDHEAVKQHMQQAMPAPHNLLVGPMLGFVVECKAVVGWPACVDIFIPTLRLAIQVDGEHHDLAPQQEIDKRFMQQAQGQGMHAFRLSYKDQHNTFQLLWDVIKLCMQHQPGHACISMVSPSHPMLSRDV